MPDPQPIGDPSEVVDVTIRAIKQRLTGIADVEHPAPISEQPFSKAEENIARIKAALRLKPQQFERYKTLPKESMEVEALGQVHPEVSQRLGIQPGDALKFTKDTVSAAWDASITAMGFIGDQLARPHQAITKTALGLAEGDSLGQSVKEGLKGAAYGATNPDYTSFSDVLAAAGYDKGDVYYEGSAHLPQVNQQQVAGKTLDFLLDPITYAGIGSSRGSQLLTKTGKYLNKKGVGILFEMERAGALSENPAIRKMLEYHNRHDLLTAMDHVAPLAKEILENPVPSVISKNRGPVIKAYTALADHLAKAGAEGRMSIPHPTIPGDTIHVPDFQPFLTQVYQDRLAELIEKNPKLMNQFVDKGGLKVGGITLIPGDMMSSAITAPVRLAGAATTGLGKGMGRTRIPGVSGIGAFIERQPDNIARARDAFGKAFSTTFRLSPEFKRVFNTEYIAKFKQAESVLKMQIEKLFRGTTAIDREAITKAIDGGTTQAFVAARPEMQPIIERLQGLQEDLWQNMTKRGLAKEERRRDNYIYHYYKNPTAVRKYFMEHPEKIADPRKMDPSSYQRVFPTLAEAEAAGLQPDYDAAHLLTMRMFHGNSAIITHDFIKEVVERFKASPDDLIGLPEKVKEAARKSGLLAHGAVGRTDSAILARSIGDLTQPGREIELAQRLVAEGKTDIRAVRALPEGHQREFLRHRLAQAAFGGEKEFANTQKKYGEFKHLWPKGDSGSLLGDTFGLPRPVPKDGPYRPIAIPGHGEVILPQRIAEKLTEIQQTGIFNKAGGPMKDLLAWYDSYLNAFRKINTGPWPAFHVRNYYTNIMNSGMDIGLAVMNPVTRMQANKLLTGHGKNILIKTKAGEVIPGQMLKAEWVRFGGAQAFFKQAEITSGAAIGLSDDVLRDLSANRYINPFWWGGKTGEYVENHARLVHYMALRKDGFGPAEAMEHVNRFLFDYGNSLTPVEREFFRRIFPFWSWISQNTRLQTQMLLQKPRIFTGYDKFFRAAQTDNDPERVNVHKDLLPAFLKTEYGITLPVGKEKQMTRWMLGIDIPTAEFAKFKDGTLTETVAQWLSQMGPLPDTAQALFDLANTEDAATNGIDDGRKGYRALALMQRVPGFHKLAEWLEVKDGFDLQGRQIIKANPAKLKVLAAMTLMERPLRELSEFVGPEDGWISALARFFTGTRFINANPEQLRTFRVDKAVERVHNHLSKMKQDLTTGIQKEAMEPGSALTYGQEDR